MKTRNFKDISNHFVYWDNLSQPYLNKVDFRKTTIKDIIPLFREMTSEEQKPLAPYIYEFYGANFLINKVCKEHSNIVPEEYLELYFHYQNTLKEMSKKIFSYIFINSFIESSFCKDFSKPVSQYLEKKMKNYDIFNNDLDYREFVIAMKKPEGQEVLTKLIQQFAPQELQTKELEPSLKALFMEISFNNQNLYSMTVAEMADEVMSGYSMSGFKELSLSQVTAIVKNIFKIGKFDVNYGGHRWGDILSHFEKFIEGQINAEIFIDQAFSLEHNNGTLFSKHTIFKTSENFNILLTDSDNSISFDERYLNFNKLLLNAQNNSSVFVATHMDYSELLQKLLKNNLKEDFENLQQFQILQSFLQNECSRFIAKFQDIIPHYDNVILSPMLNEGSIWDTKFKLSHLSINSNKPFSFHLFNLQDVGELGLDKYRIGGKAHGLGQLKQLGINTPDGIVLDSYTCLSFLGKPQKFQQTFKKQLKHLMKPLGSVSNPKMVSVRSGSAISMPGMMDTVLNVGIDDYTYKPLCLKYGTDVINSCASQFMHAFLKNRNLEHRFPLEAPFVNQLLIFKNLLKEIKIPLTGNNFPLSRESQLFYCVTDVFNSWNSPRAIAWRNDKEISHKLGTACTIQQMVLGNKNSDSMSGVIFSRDCVHGGEGMIGEYIIQSQGESIVNGSVIPQDIEFLKDTHPHVYQELMEISQTLENAHSEIKDIEFTVEDNKLYILQHRKAVATPQANILLLKDYYDISDIDLKLLENSLEVQTTQKADVQGKPAQEGILHGIVISKESDKETFKQRFKELQKNEYTSSAGWILSTTHSSPEHVPLLLQSDAFLTQQGGYTSHASIIARSLKKPCIVGTGIHSLQPGDIITMNAYTGEIWKGIIPIVYDNQKSYSLAREIITSSDYNPDDIEAETLKTEQITSWFEKFPNAKIVDKNDSKDSLSNIQKAAIILVNHHKKNKL